MSHWTFYQDEREDHRVGLGKYAGERQYKSGLPFSIEQFPYVAFINPQCAINLIEDKPGLWCECCCRYHAKYHFKRGWYRVCEPLKERGAALPLGYLNPGINQTGNTYRSDWTADDDCFTDPFPEPIQPKFDNVSIEPGEDFWARVNLWIRRA